LSESKTGAFEKFERRLDKVSLYCIYVSAALIFFMLWLQFADVMGRYLFRAPIQMGQGIMEVLLPAVVVMSLAYIQRVKAHVRVRIVYDHMPRSVQLVMDVAVLTVSVVMWVIVGWISVVVILTQAEMGQIMDTLRIPYWWPRVILPVGMLFLYPALVSDVIQAVKDLKNLRKGRR